MTRRPISSYLETNGTLEAENEVDIVARTAGPIVELAAEEGMFVEKGRLLAQIDETELGAQLEIARVNVEKTRLAYERAKASRESEIISQEVHDQALSNHETAKAQLLGAEVLLGYARITAPFSGLIVRRNVKFAEHVGVNHVLFRISDFDPLLCPIQVPEKDLGRLRLRQPAHLAVEAWPGERFSASVLRLSPVVEAATGTVKVTLAVEGRKMLRPGMFASVFLQVDTRADALVIPKRALVLDSIGDTVYVADADRASRREVELGYMESEWVEIRRGLAENDRVIVVGQDGLSEGTPITLLDGSPPARAAEAPQSPALHGPDRSRGAEAHGPPPGGRPGFMDVSQMTPEQIQALKTRMRERGLTDEQIEERLNRMRQRAPQ